MSCSRTDMAEVGFEPLTALPIELCFAYNDIIMHYLKMQTCYKLNALVICIHGPLPMGMTGIMTFHFSEPWYKPCPVGTS